MCVDWTFPSWRPHGVRQRYRHWRRHDCCYDRHHRGTVYEPGARIYVRNTQECSDLFILIPVYLCACLLGSVMMLSCNLLDLVLYVVQAICHDLLLKKLPFVPEVKTY